MSQCMTALYDFFPDIQTVRQILINNHHITEDEIFDKNKYVVYYIGNNNRCYEVNDDGVWLEIPYISENFVTKDVFIISGNTIDKIVLENLEEIQVD